VGTFVALNLFVIRKEIIMKKTILIATIFAFIAGTASVSYGQSHDQKAGSERENIQDANRKGHDEKLNSKEAQRNSAFEYQKFKKEADNKIRSNEQRIANLKTKIARIHSREKAEYQKNLRVLEQNNTKLKRKLTSYKEREQNKWMSFKREFDHDADEISDALKDFTIGNKH
jgi:hypothetical protein